MKVGRYLIVGSLLAVCLAAGLCCSEMPPPRSSGEWYGPNSEEEAAHASGSSSASAVPARPMPYPRQPKAPPPVPPPAGDGAAVKLQPHIVIDQFGYSPAIAKVAVIATPELGWNPGDGYVPGSPLEVRKWSDRTVVFKAPISAWNQGKLDTASGDHGAWFDFSLLRDPGTYYVYDPKNDVRSYPFEIGDDVYRSVLKAAARMYYFNRANVAKKPPFSCVGTRCWSLGADYVGPHQDREARSISDRNNARTARDLSGGWWDAGDTDKYVTFTNDPVHQLLTAYEEHPSPFTDDFGIPESGNGTPDLLDEVMVELDWLKRMQASDLKGGALLKLGVADFGEPIPDQSKFPRYYYPKPCSSSTIVVSGVFAHAALVFRRLPKWAAYGAELEQRAKEAWTWYQANPHSDACDDGTIKSGDADVSLQQQDRIAVIAAVYLFALTGDAHYDEYVRKNFGVTRPFQDDLWSIYEQSQGDALLYYADLPNADAATKSAIIARKKSLATSSDVFQFRPDLDLYRAYMRIDQYHWGSNNQRGAYGNTNYDMVQHQLALGGERLGYLERAAGMLHSFHGVNPMQLVYLTNMYAYGGDACADEMFHTWFRDNDPRWDNARTSELGPAPGYVTGGPNKHYCEGQDPKANACTHSPVQGQPAGKSYLDTNTGWDPKDPNDRSWEFTEPGIYYQASYVRLVSKFVN